MGEENTAQHCAVWMLYRSRDSKWSLNFYHSPARLLIEAIPCADWLCSYCVWQSEISPEEQITKLTFKASEKTFSQEISSLTAKYCEFEKAGSCAQRRRVYRHHFCSFRQAELGALEECWENGIKGFPLHNLDMKLDSSKLIWNWFFRSSAPFIRWKSEPFWKDNLWAPKPCTQSSTRRPRPFETCLSWTGLRCVLVPIASLPILGMWAQNAAMTNSVKQVHSILID